MVKQLTKEQTIVVWFDIYGTMFLAKANTSIESPAYLYCRFLKAHKQWTRFNTFNITKALLLLLLLFLYKYCFQEHTFLKYSRGMEAKANSMSTSSFILTNQAPHSLYFYLRAVID